MTALGCACAGRACPLLEWPGTPRRGPRRFVQSPRPVLGHRSGCASTDRFSRPARRAGAQPLQEVPHHGHPRRHQRLRPDRSPVAQGADRARPGRRGGRRQRPGRRRDERPPVQARLDLRDLSGRRPRGRRLDHHRRPRDQDPGRARPGRAAVGRPRRRHRAREHRHLHRRDQGQGAHRRRRQEGHHQRAGQERGHHDRPRRQRGSLRPGGPPHHQQRQLHHELPGPGGQGGPRPADHRARA